MKKMRLNCFVWSVLLTVVFSVFVTSTAGAQETETLSMYETFISGGVVYMSLITLCLVGMLLAAWKMPSRVAILGRMALIIGWGNLVFGIYHLCGVLRVVPDLSLDLFFGGLRVGLIAPIWGSIVYFISLVIRLIQKPNMI